MFDSATFFESEVNFASWNASEAACLACFDTDLADVNQEVAASAKAINVQFFIGSFEGSVLVQNLVWFTASGNIAVVADSVSRPALCSNPHPSPSPSPLPSPSPVSSTPSSKIPTPPTPTPTPTPMPPTA